MPTHIRRVRRAPSLAAALAAVLVTALMAPAIHAAEPVVPGAGSILQQTQPVGPPAPSSNGTGLAIDQPGGGAPAASAPFPVRTIELSGNTVLDTATLRGLVAEAEGQSLTLAQLGRVAARITVYYQRHGYPLARAIIPAQTIRDGVVRIEIIEAHYGQVALENSSRVSDALLQATLAGVQGGQAVSQVPLDHALLLLSDIPGVAVSGTLKPGEAVGASDLQVDTTPTPSLIGNVALDNDGNRYTGRARVQGTVSLIEPARHGDTLSLTGLTSGDMDYANLSYEALLNGEGTRLGASYSALRYILGDTLRALDGRGSAEVDSVWARQPLVRTPAFNLYGEVQYDHKQLDDAIGASDLHTDRHLDDGSASVRADLRDALLTGGVNTWDLGWTLGYVGFDSGHAQLDDAATADTRGRFSLWSASASRLQRLGSADALYVAISGQWSDANLDPAEKMVVGGAYTVRAYDMGVLSADSGILASIEWRHELGVLWYGRLQAVGFADSQHVTINHTVWVAGPNSATLSGAGLGLNASWPREWTARVTIAAPLGSTPSLIGSNDSVRVWLALNKGF